MTADLDRIRHALSFVPPDDRDTWVRMAMSIKSMVGEEGFQDWDEWSQAADSYKAADALSCWKSCSGNGAVTAGTLFYEAAKHGWKESSDWVRPDPTAVHAAREAAKERAQHDQAKKDRERDIAAVKASELWAKGTWADGHPYLTRKGVSEVPSLREITSTVAAQVLGYTPQSDGAKLEGRLLIVPVKIRGRLSTLEMIDESGRKTALAGGAKKGGYWSSEDLPDGDGAGITLLIGEGVATALSASTATGAIAVATLSSGNLTAVAIELHGTYPHARLIILADIVKTTGDPDPHAIAAGKAVDCTVVFPLFQNRRPDQTDFNDMASASGIEAVKSAILATPRDPRKPPPAISLIPTEKELAESNLAPRCIVSNHTYADVAQVVAPGGTGKTTILIYESVHIALGRQLYGLDVISSGWTLYISAEDQRPRLMARLREILSVMELSPAARLAALSGFRVWDVAGECVKLIKADGQNIVLTSLADEVVDAYKDDPPAVVVFDPLISFGASEQAINDNEQGLVTASRRIVKGLSCCVRLVHHTGKGNARDATMDQYSGRGGSALADGSRMTTVLQAWNPDSGSTLTPPPGCQPGPDASITMMARAKLSFAPPQPLIWLRRSGFAFEHWTEAPKLSPSAARSAQADQVHRYLVSQLSAARYHSLRSIRDSEVEIGLGRRCIERAVNELLVAGRVVEADLPEHLRHGARKTYLNPLGLAQ